MGEERCVEGEELARGPGRMGGHRHPCPVEWAAWDRLSRDGDRRRVPAIPGADPLGLRVLGGHWLIQIVSQRHRNDVGRVSRVCPFTKYSDERTERFSGPSQTWPTWLVPQKQRRQTLASTDDHVIIASVLELPRSDSGAEAAGRSAQLNLRDSLAL